MDPWAMLEEAIRQDMRRIGKVLLVLALAFALLAFAVFSALAHTAVSGWSYPVACCSGLDCREVDDQAIIRDARGYVIKATGELVPQGSPKLKASPDGLFHWCSRQGKPDSETICLFVPPEAF